MNLNSTRVFSEEQLLSAVIVSSIQLGYPAGYTAVYCGRGPAPAGMEQANMGNPFRVGTTYAQGQAAEVYLSYLRQQVIRIPVDQLCNNWETRLAGVGIKSVPDVELARRRIPAGLTE